MAKYTNFYEMVKLIVDTVEKDQLYGVFPIMNADRTECGYVGSIPKEKLIELPLEDARKLIDSYTWTINLSDVIEAEKNPRYVNAMHELHALMDKAYQKDLTT